MVRLATGLHGAISEVPRPIPDQVNVETNLSMISNGVYGTVVGSDCRITSVLITLRSSMYVTFKMYISLFIKLISLARHVLQL